MSRLPLCWLVAGFLGLLNLGTWGYAQETMPQVDDVQTQPLLAQVKRLGETMKYLGEPLPKKSRDLIRQAAQEKDDGEIRKLVQQALDPFCLAAININPESRVKVSAGIAPLELNQNGWRVFLVKVHNEAGVTSMLRSSSPQGLPIAGSKKEDVRDRWMQITSYNQRPMPVKLTGIKLEYRPVLIYSRDSGKRTAVISFDVGQGSQDIGFRNDVSLTFNCRKALSTKLSIKDENGKPTIAAIEITDSLGRVYPSQAKRIAPDFHFQRQVYRKDGESIELPEGSYRVKCTRGPEYHAQTKNIEVKKAGQGIEFDLIRWIDPSKKKWWSGDHHIHAAGCAHYSNPTQGVHAPDMMRHCIGEDLKVGANLTWGPCFDYQKQFFSGKIDKVSQYPYLLRYDVEVSGFGSHQSGHLCLLRLNSQIHPGGESTDHWPTLCLNTLKWAQKQGAVCGPAHSGWGLEVPSDRLPNYTVPPYSGIGANEYIVDVTHRVEGPEKGVKVPAVDFMSMCDTPYPWEMNIWYHTLNCGFRTRISGETDFPCIYGERVGLGRSYVKLEGKLTYDQWCEGISKGACYVSDGRSHLMDFSINQNELGENDSEIQATRGDRLKIRADVAALLREKPLGGISKRHFAQKPYWHIERARIGVTRDVMLELVVNGFPVEKKQIQADGKINEISFDYVVKESCWVAIRILGSSHTNPFFVVVDDKPIWPSKKSAQWCLDSVDQCWKNKKRFIRKAELKDAEAAYEHARATYRKILAEATDDR